jgi:hypothetical protein
MADNLCGPSNAAKNLVNHVNRDRSLQQDRMVSGTHGNNLSVSIAGLNSDSVAAIGANATY